VVVGYSLGGLAAFGSVLAALAPPDPCTPSQALSEVDIDGGEQGDDTPRETVDECASVHSDSLSSHETVAGARDCRHNAVGGGAADVQDEQGRGMGVAALSGLQKVVLLAPATVMWPLW